MKHIRLNRLSGSALRKVEALSSPDFQRAKWERIRESRRKRAGLDAGVKVAKGRRAR